MSKSSLRALACAAFFAIPFNSPVFANDPLEIVVTADRTDVPLKNTGSAITVITSEEIAKYGAKNVADVLRTVPGAFTSEAGGIGSSTTVTLRGGLPGQSLVMIDGVRIGDPSGPDGSFDFGNLSAANIERIEILRGPQSALYGSDAMSGVINIITKKGSGAPHRSITFEAGSYGTAMVRADQSGSTDKWTYSIGLNALHSDAYPRYGYRSDLSTWKTVQDFYNLYFSGDNQADAIANYCPKAYAQSDGQCVLPNWPKLPSSDPVNKGGLNGRFSYRASDQVSVDFGVSLYGNQLKIDAPSSFYFYGDPTMVYDSYNRSMALVGNAFTHVLIDTMDGNLKNDVTLFANNVNRNVWMKDLCSTYFPDDPMAIGTPFDCRNGYSGNRYGAEYQGNLNVRSSDTVIFGMRSETEAAKTDTSLSPNPLSDGEALYPNLNAQQNTNSIFTEYRLAVTDKLDVSLGGRIDSMNNGNYFDTWRATSSYRISETATKLRASYGTGAKAPTLYQNFLSSGDLQPEFNVGYDLGIDQEFFDRNLKISLTYFNIAYRNLISFGALSDWGWPMSPEPCLLYNVNGGCYYNSPRVNSSGLEASITSVLIPNELSLTASYTYNDAYDQNLGHQAFHTPLNRASLSLSYLGFKNWTIEPRMLLVGESYDYSYYVIPNDLKLPGYARLDVYSNYKVSDKLDVFGRIENLTDARYHEIFNYGTPGRSYYAGVTYQW